MTFTRLQTPKGTRDYLPGEAERYRFIETELADLFELWGYQEVRSPTIEFVQVLSTGVGEELVDNMFKFQDFDGKMLALRTEMTAPVSRIVSTKMTSIPEPIRLFYVSNVFRYSQSYADRGREFRQAGAELIGSNTPKADAEILSLLVSSLRKIGLKEIRVDIGHASLLKDLLTATGFDAEKNRVFRNLLAYRDETRLEQFMEQNRLPPRLTEAFLHLSHCRRLDEVSSMSLLSSEFGDVDKHLRDLSTVNELLSQYGIANSFFFDFSLTRKIEYYTGIVFEASVPNLGLPIGGGGRYDDFIRKFGTMNLPANGFALEIERCLHALTAQGFKIPKKAKITILVSSPFDSTAVQAVERLRARGFVTLIDVTRYDEKQIINYAKLAGIDFVLFVGSSLKKLATVYDLQSNTSSRMSYEAFTEKLGEITAI